MSKNIQKALAKVTKMERLAPKPGEVLIITMPDPDPRECEAIQQFFEKAAPGIPVVIFDEVVKAAVATPPA